MAKTFIFAIGGTGARVLRSLTMLMASGVKGMTEDICPIIIDYDLHNGDKDRAITCMKKYSEIQSLVANGDGAKLEDNNNGYRPYFSTKIGQLNGITDWSWQFTLRRGMEILKYSDYIDYDNVNLYTPTSQDFVNCLYDTNINSVYTELNLNMKEGFQGNPNIGSVVFNDLKGNNEFNAFSDSFRAGDRIVVIGSIFGGTGSSGIPKIVSAIRNHSKADIKNASLSVVLVLPYFAVNSSNDKEISIKSNIFNSKTKAALNYYDRSGLNAQINSIYYVGDKVQTKVEPHLGNKEQKNNAHIVELIGAMSVAHFITSAQNGNQRSKYKFNAANDIVNGIGIHELIGESNSWAQNKFVVSILHNLINFMLSVHYFLDNIVCSQKRMDERQFYKELKLNFDNKKIKSSGNASPIQDYCAALYDFICKKENVNDDDGFWPWMEELHNKKSHGTHCLKIFDLDKGNIVDFLSEFNFRSEPKKMKIPFKGEVEIAPAKPLMEYSDQFDSSLNNALVPYRKGQKQLQEEPKEAYPYIFNDILTKMPEEVRKFDAKLEERFQMVP